MRPRRSVDIGVHVSHEAFDIICRRAKAKETSISRVAADSIERDLGVDELQFLRCYTDMEKARKEYLELHTRVCCFLDHKKELENELEKLDKRVTALEKGGKER